MCVRTLSCDVARYKSATKIALFHIAVSKNLKISYLSAIGWWRL